MIKIIFILFGINIMQLVLMLYLYSKFNSKKKELKDKELVFKLSKKCYETEIDYMHEVLKKQNDQQTLLESLASLNVDSLNSIRSGMLPTDGLPDAKTNPMGKTSP